MISSAKCGFIFFKESQKYLIVLKKLSMHVEKKFGCSIRVLRTDGECEYVSKEFSIVKNEAFIMRLCFHILLNIMELLSRRAELYWTWHEVC